MVNLQSKALAQHVVQPFLESVEDKILNRGSNTTRKPFHGKYAWDGYFSIYFQVLLYNEKKNHFKRL